MWERTALLLALCLQLGLGDSISTVRLEAPENGSSTVMANPHFSWLPACDPRAVNARCRYALELAEDPGFAHVVVNDTLEAVITRFVPADSLAPGLYYWRVWVEAASGRPGARSGLAPTVWSFRVVQPAHLISVPATASFSQMQSAFADGCEQPSTRVQFEPGQVRTLDPGDAGCFINLTNCTDLVVDFGGARLSFSRWISFVHVLDSARVSVRNLTVDLQPLPYTALELSRVGPGHTISGRVARGHPPPELLNITVRNKGEVLDGATTRTKRGVIEVVNFMTNWTVSSSGEYTLELKTEPHAAGIAPGDVFVMGERTGPPGFQVLGSHEVVLSHLVAQACANECFTSAYTEQLSILHCGLKLRPGRFKAANDGGHNHHSARIGAWIEAGDWESTGDDICHVSGLVFSATAAQGSTLELHRYAGDAYAKQHGGHLGVVAGDVLQMYDHAEGVILAERKVLSVSPVGTGQQVMLDGPALAPMIKTGIISGDPNAATQIFNLNASATQFVFRNNRVLNGRRFGVLAKGSRLLVSHNWFVGLGNGAVQFLNSPFEGLCARHAVVKQNYVQDVMQLYTKGALPNGAFWTASLPPRASPGPLLCHQDILFEGNMINSGPHPGFAIGGAADVQIAHSDVITCDDDHALNAGYPPIFVGQDSSNSTVSVAHTHTRYEASPRLCSKRPSLVQLRGAGTSLYFLKIKYGSQVSQVLHPVSDCHQCGDDLCARWGVQHVSSDFIQTKRVGPPFNCTLLPLPRFIRCSDCPTNSSSIYFQPSVTEIHRISSCTQCPGNLCSNVVHVTPTYFNSLSLLQDFKCSMLLSTYEH